MASREKQDPQQQWQVQEDVNTAVKPTNKDDAGHMARSVMNVASSMTLDEVCRCSKSSVVHTMEKEAEQEQEPSIKIVHINSVRFNSNHAAILANLKHLLTQSQ